jgi:hypothetical protein
MIESAVNNEITVYWKEECPWGTDSIASCHLPAAQRTPHLTIARDLRSSWVNQGLKEGQKLKSGYDRRLGDLIHAKSGG